MTTESQKQPWEYHPDLSLDRLQVIASLIYTAASSAFGRHEPRKGDDGWSLGCVRFARCRNLLLDKASTASWSWFGIINDSKRLIFRIGAVPVRFCRGRVASPPERTLAIWSDEVYQRSLAFPEDETLANITWRLLVETGPLGDPSKLVFAGYTSKRSVHCSWDIGIPDIRSGTEASIATVPLGVEIDEPRVEAKEGASENAR